MHMLTFGLFLILTLAALISSQDNVCFNEAYSKHYLSGNTCRIHRFLHNSFTTWNFSDQVLYKTFPIDPVQENYVRKVPGSLFSVTYPIPFKSRTTLAAVSGDALVNLLDMDLRFVDTPEFLQFVSGQITLHGSVPLSHRYGGHQFGSWADQLGDGRAVMLGAYTNLQRQRWELQLKGSGLTPYSRRGDGRAVIRSSVREFLCSEAMYYLGIPTSRAAALVVSEDKIVRDQFYDGHPRFEKTAVVLRLAESWFRIGSLEICTKKGEITLLRKLVDFVIVNYFKSINPSGKDRVLEFYSEVVQNTAHMIALWQCVGFTHGVCNTDNFSLLSITIDYGPFGFLDEYNPSFVPNTSDDEGMYSYERQPDVAIFNLDKLAVALLPLLDSKQKKHLPIILRGYAEIYKQKFMDLFRRKLGIGNTIGDDDEQLVAILLKMMEETKADFTLTFRHLGELNLSEIELITANTEGENTWALKVLSKHKWWKDWLDIYRRRLDTFKITENHRQSMMNRVNPRYILRNWIAQKVIEETENGTFEKLKKVLRILSKPFDKQEEAEEEGYAASPPYWAKTLKVSCSS